MKKLLLILLGSALSLTTNAISLVWSYNYPHEYEYQLYDRQFVYDIARNDSGVYTIRHLLDTVNLTQKIELTKLTDAGALSATYTINPGPGFSELNQCFIETETSGSVLSLIQYQPGAPQSIVIMRHAGNLTGQQSGKQEDLQFHGFFDV